MAELEEMQNIFGFDNSELDICELDKTACFFCPSENGGENSFSTQMTDDMKENSIPMTPEQSDQAKPKVKIYTLKRKVLSEQKSKRSNPFDLNVDTVSLTRDNIAQLIKSESVSNGSQVKALPALKPIIFQFRREKTAPSTIVKEPVACNIEIKAPLMTETGLEFENYSFCANLQNTTAQGSLYKASEQSTDNNTLKFNPQETFIIRKPAKNKIQVKNSLGSKASNPVSNLENQPLQNLAVQTIQGNDFMRLTKFKPKSLQFNTEADLESTNLETTESNFFRNPPSFDLVKLGNYASQTFVNKNPLFVNHKKMPSFLNENQEDKINIKNVVIPKIAPANVKIKVVKRKDIANPYQEQEPSIQKKTPGSFDFIGFPKNNLATREAMHIPKIQQERPKSRFKTQEVVLSRLFNMKNK